MVLTKLCKNEKLKARNCYVFTSTDILQWDDWIFKCYHFTTVKQIIYLSDLYLKMNGQKNACLNVIVKYLKIIGHKMYILMWL